MGSRAAAGIPDFSIGRTIGENGQRSNVDGLSNELVALGALAVDETTLRRIIKVELGLTDTAGLRVPHHHCIVARKATLQALPRLARVDFAAYGERVIVVTDEHDAPNASLRAWRRVFHARIHLVLDERIAREELTVEGARDRIDQIGQAEFDEVRSVLHQEHLLVPPGDDRVAYCEFVALYLELARFAPDTLVHTFPAISDFAHIDALVAKDLDVATLLAASRPASAPAHPFAPAPDAIQPTASAAIRAATEPATVSTRRAASKARSRGNLARAAILSARADDPNGARQHLELLVDRLVAALALPDNTVTSPWVDALLPVATYAGQQESLRFNMGTRLLADLQAACTYAERHVKVVDLVTWALSLGRRKVVRDLPVTREVRVAKRLHKARTRVAACELEATEDRARLAELLRTITARADSNVRTSLRPKVEAALDAVGLEPHSLPERVAQKKLVDELLDRAVDLGRLTLGDLRDAISKNDLKMPDLSLDGLRGGDQLLRADRILADSLDGVYRGGEVYMRLLQKGSSILFGTKLGRVLTRYALLPLLGALAVVEGLQHMIGPLMHLITGHEPVIATTTTRYGGAAFLFLVLHVRPFRRAVLFVLRWLWRGIRLLFFDLPRALWRFPIVRRIVNSRFNRWLVRPAIPTLIVAFAIVDGGRYRWPIAAAVFAVTALVANSSLGRLFEERTADWVILSSRQLTTRFIPGLVRFTLDLFGKLADLVDRALYRVDELLRFRSGQSVVKLVIKGGLSAIWFVVAYVLRLYVDLFIEPTTNPIKHFPVVTVAAKILIPFTPAILSGVAGPASQLMGPAVGNGFAAFTVIVLPGLAGFLVWELKENWKLYRATRAAELGPQAIGSHGESMVGLLKPGFHSGTIPKLFRKLRRASWSNDPKGITKQHEVLHHVEHAIEKFVDRQLVSMLVEVEAFGARDVALTEVFVGSNRVQITIACPSRSATPVVLRFELQSGWIVGSIAEVGWIAQLDDLDRRILEITLAGFYKLAGVSLVREQLEQALRDGASAPPAYDISDDGLVVWPDRRYGTELVYDLRASKLVPRTRGAVYSGAIIDLGGRHAIFGREPLYWSVWATTWQQIQRGETPMPIMVGPSVLPPRSV
jgi:hypothetical protein